MFVIIILTQPNLEPIMKHTAPHLLSLLVFAKALAAQAPPDAAQVDRATAALDAALR